MQESSQFYLGREVSILLPYGGWQRTLTLEPYRNYLEWADQLQAVKLTHDIAIAMCNIFKHEYLQFPEVVEQMDNVPYLAYTELTLLTKE